MEKLDITAHVYGRLTVISQVHPPSGQGARWLCKCECGNEKICWTRKLRNGKAKSCGCLTSEWVKSFGGAFVDKAMEKVRKHGHASDYTRSAEYSSWSSMKQRCYNQNTQSWPRYGGRGITVFDSWVNDFQNFFAYMGPMPKVGYTLDRLDANGNYEPGNVRWATKAEQGEENKSTLVAVTVCGIEYPSIRSACRALGVHPASVYKRMWKGIPKEKAFDGLKSTL